jgi:cyclic pyranopterin phosphate synthase
MPHEDMKFMPSEQLMQKEEILAIASIFTELGVDKIRLTGGEPMMRKDFMEITEGLAQLKAGIHLTTNAFFLDEHLDGLHRLGMRSINISLDSLSARTNAALTQRDGFQRVWKNIEKAIAKGWHVKLNMVVMKGKNDHEIADFVRLTQTLPVHIRFTEFMPFKGNRWDISETITYKQMLEIVRSKFDIERISDRPNDTSKNFRCVGAPGTFAWISSVTNPFCDSCNRIRLTADGKIRNCLFARDEIDLLTTYRQGGDVHALIQQSISGKHYARGGNPPFSQAGAKDDYEENRSMISIGG